MTVITTPSHASMISKIRGMPTRAKQVHRNRWREAKNGERKHKGDWS